MPSTLSQEETELLNNACPGTLPQSILHLHQNGLKITNANEHEFLTATFKKLELQLSAKEESLTDRNKLVLSVTRKLVAQRDQH